MIKNYTAILIAASVLFICSCSNNGAGGEKPVAKGDRAYGGCLHLSITDNYQTLYPMEVTDANSVLIFTQINDGLVKLNTSTLKVEPCLAEKWEVDPSGTQYIFHLKKGAMFQDDECYEGGKGREIKAGDVKYSFELLCTKNQHNQNFVSTFKDRVAGANKFFGTGGELEGIKVIDDYTVAINLVRPSTVFLTILAEPACAIVSKEAIERYGKNIKTAGAGAFVLDVSRSIKDRVVLTRNPNYHGKDKFGNQLPFLDSIVIMLIPSKEQELALFKEGKIDMIASLPSQSVKEMVESQIKDFQSKPPKFVLDNSPEMITQYYTMNTRRPPFDNVKVRKALNLAINRQKIVDEVLNGQAYGSGIKGITPPTFTAEGYDISALSGYGYDKTEAKKLLAEAGYPNGKGFPEVKIILNSGGARNSDVVVEIQKELMENLGINIDFDVIPFAQKLEESRTGRADISRDAWVADYPSPEAFLNMFYGANVPADPTQVSFPNTSRYQNAEYDKYFEMGRDAKTKDSSMIYFMKAEQILIDDAPIIVLWYESNYRLTQYRIKNSSTNAMHYRNFSETYIMDEQRANTGGQTVIDSVSK